MGGRQGGETTTPPIHPRTGTIYMANIGATGRTETGPIVTVGHS